MFRRIVLFICFSVSVIISHGQDIIQCPQNIGFEEGNLNGWKAYTSHIREDGTYDPFVPGEVEQRHSVIKKGSLQDNLDNYGRFSLDSPNGSGYIIRLGNEGVSSEAERITYTLNVPLNVDAYSIVFNYAVVLQNPGHEIKRQPKFTVSVFDETTNSSAKCATFEFTAPGVKGGGIPGFANANVGDSVLYKSWSPVLVNLTSYLGHTIRLEFTTNDCSEGGHFGYAYIDIDENCANSITGNITCSEKTSMTLKAFPGFAAYRWYNADTKVTYGTKDTLFFAKVPPIGTKIAVELVPQPFYGGCIETIYTTIKNMEPITVKSEIINCSFVDLTAKSVTAGNRPDLVYSYWKDEKATIPISDPRHVNVSGKYFIMGQLFPSGCYSIVPVTVNLIPLPPIPISAPDPVSYPMTMDITKTYTPQQDMTYTYWRDQAATIPLHNPAHLRVGGTYYIKGVSTEGCIVVTPVRVDIALPDIVIPNTFTPNGDGINDVLTVLIDSRIKIKAFRIYSRWGQQVYVTSDITEFWNGYKGSSKAPSGVYFWFLEGIDNSQKYLRQGSVTVIR